MNILYITFTNNGGGATTALVNIAKGMSALGHRVWVLTNNDKGPLPKMIEAVGGKVLYGPVYLTVFPRGGSVLGRVKRLIKYMISWHRSRKLIAQIIKQHDIQLVHSNVGPMNLAYKACQQNHIPHIWHLREYHDLALKMNFFPSNKTFLKLIHKNGNYNIAITKGIFDYYGLRPNIDSVIYDGVFPKSAVQESYSELKEDYFLFVGRVEEAKGPHYILKPFRELINDYPTYRLIIAGQYFDSDTYYLKIKEMISEYHLEDSVEFLGNRNDVYDLMRRAKAIIVTSNFEGFGFITAEAMLNNCLVIGRNTAGTKEQFDIGLEITGHEVGLRFNTEKELLNCLNMAVVNDTSLMTQDARRVVIQKYTLEKNVSDLLSFYKKCIMRFNNYLSYDK